MLPIASPERAMEVFRAEFDAAWSYGGMWIAGWHPFVSGRPSRCEAMVALVEYMQRKGQVWFARLDEIRPHDPMRRDRRVGAARGAAAIRRADVAGRAVERRGAGVMAKRFAARD
jgi:hypothetical protein